MVGVATNAASSHLIALLASLNRLPGVSGARLTSRSRQQRRQLRPGRERDAPDARAETIERRRGADEPDQPQLGFGALLQRAHHGGLDHGPVVVVGVGAREVADPGRALAPRAATGVVGQGADHATHAVGEAVHGHARDRGGVLAQCRGRPDEPVARFHRRAVPAHPLQPEIGFVRRQDRQGRDLAGDLRVEDQIVDIEQDGHAARRVRRIVSSTWIVAGTRYTTTASARSARASTPASR